MRLAIVGRGRAGTTLEPLLRSAGMAPAWTWDRGDPQPLSRMAPADVILLAVSDGAIEAVARELAVRPSAGSEIWLHLSGSRDGLVCRVDEARPAAAGAMHPLQALPGRAVAPDHLAGVTAGIDGEPDACTAGETIARALGMHPVRLATGTKSLYHAAAVSVAGHITALFAQAQEMLRACGFDEEAARGVLRPLAAGAVANLAQGAPAEVVTGPIARGDLATVQAHLAAIEALDAREGTRLAVAYRELARTALELSRPQLDPVVARALEEALAER